MKIISLNISMCNTMRIYKEEIYNNKYEIITIII